MRAAVGSAHRHPGPALRSSPIKRMRGQVGAEISLFGIGVHSRVSEFLGHLLLCPREKWHRDEGNTGQENSGNAVLRSFSAHVIGNGLITDVNSQCQEAQPYDPQTELLISFARLNVCVNGHPPKQHEPDVTSIKLSMSKPTRAMLPENTPATTPTSPSKLFHAIVKCSKCFPRQAIAWRFIVSDCRS